jgi:hypothetical protein
MGYWLIYSQHMPRETEGTYEKPQSGWLVSGASEYNAGILLT